MSAFLGLLARLSKSLFVLIVPLLCKHISLMEHQRNNNGSVFFILADHIFVVVDEEPGNDMFIRITVNNLFNVYVTSHGAIITAVLSVQGPIQSETQGIMLIFSAIFFILLLHIFFR